MIRIALSLATTQFRHPRYRYLTLLGIALSAVLLFAAYALFLTLIGLLTDEGLVLFDDTEITGLGTFFTGKSLFYMMFVSVFLMVPVASAFTGLFLHDVADTVEDVYYPHIRRGTRPDGYRAFTQSLNYIGLLLPANLAAMVAFGISGFFQGMIFFYAINGWLLSREYFTMIAERHSDRNATRAMRQRNRRVIALAGLGFAVCLSIPVINLAMPVIWTAVFTHLFHQMRIREVSAAV